MKRIALIACALIMITSQLTAMPISISQGSYRKNYSIQLKTTNDSKLYYKFFYRKNYDENNPWMVMQEYSTNSSCSYTFPENGSYTVVARMTTDPNSEPSDITIIGGTTFIGGFESPIKGFSIDPAVIAPNTAVTVTITDENSGRYYKWYYRQNYGTALYDRSPWVVVKNPSTEKSCNFIFPEEGKYIVVIRAINSNGIEKTEDPIIGCVIHCKPLINNIPDTDLITPYTNVHGQDTDYIINPPSFSKLDDAGRPLQKDATSWAMVKDNVTGLVWENKTSDNSIHDYRTPYLSFDTQNSFIFNLNSMRFGGFTDWRLPTIKELQTVANKFFSVTKRSAHWSSTGYAKNDIEIESGPWIWCVDSLDKGNNLHADSDGLSHYAIAVRGTTPDELKDSIELGSMVDNRNGTVTDIRTGLMWQQGENAPMTWEAAITYCENLKLANYEDWRLPNRNELQSLIDYSKADYSFDNAAFPNTLNEAYWTSTPAPTTPQTCYAADFGNGFVNLFYPTNLFRVRAVRGGL